MTASPGNIVSHVAIYLADKFYLIPCGMNPEFAWSEKGTIFIVPKNNLAALTQALAQAAEYSSESEVKNSLSAKIEVQKIKELPDIVRKEARATWELEVLEGGIATLQDHTNHRASYGCRSEFLWLDLNSCQQIAKELTNERHQ